VSDFQEQAKNFLRNAVKQNSERAKERLAADSASAVPAGSASATSGDESAASVDEPLTGPDDGASDAATQAGVDNAGTGESGVADTEDSGESDDSEDEAGTTTSSGGVVGGTLPDVEKQAGRSTGSGTEGAETGSTATGTSQGDRPGRTN
jgi:hypothetical protein